MVKMLMFDTKQSEREFLDGFDTSDFELTCYAESLNESTVLSIKEYDETVIVSVFTTSDVTSEVIEKFKNLRVIVSRSITCSHIDTDFCRQNNIAVINTSDYGRSAVAQYVIGVILAMTRKIFSASADVKSESYDYEKYEGEEIDKLTLGVIGTGSVGTAVCTLATKLGMKVYANDIIMNRELSDLVEYMSFNDLLRKSDIVTLHLPYVREYRHLISERELKMMKDGSYIINTSNPELIDTLALYRSLKTQKLNGATLDMMIKPKELSEADTPSDYSELRECVVTERLLRLDNVIITPRIAYNTKESLRKILRSNFNSIKDFYIGRKTNRVV